MIMNAVDRWLELGRVRPFCVLRGKTLTVRFGGGPGGGLVRGFGAAASDSGNWDQGSRDLYSMYQALRS